MEECKLQFNISGEWITGLVREWFYLEGKGYDKCIEILNDCMSGTDETKEQIRRHAEDVLLGRAALKGNIADGSYHLEIEIKQEMCDEYCKYPTLVDDREDLFADDSPCMKCPLTRL